MTVGQDYGKSAKEEDCIRLQRDQDRGISFSLSAALESNPMPMHFRQVLDH